MAFEFRKRLDEEIEQKMGNFYETLSEKDQRRFAAFQAQQLGHGAIKYLAELMPEEIKEENRRRASEKNICRACNEVNKNI